MDYYEKDGSPVSIDYETPEGKALSAKLWSREYRRVAQNYVGDVHVSTVFLPIDHGWGEGPPVLFETMVFGYKVQRMRGARSRLRRRWMDFRGRGFDSDFAGYWEEPEYQWRYCTEAEALAGHAVILGAVKRGKLSEDMVLAVPINTTQKVVDS